MIPSGDARGQHCSLTKDTGIHRPWGFLVAKGQGCGRTVLCPHNKAVLLAGPVVYSDKQVVPDQPQRALQGPALLLNSELRSCFNVPLRSRSWLRRGSSGRMLESMPQTTDARNDPRHLHFLPISGRLHMVGVVLLPPAPPPHQFPPVTLPLSKD